MSASEEEVKEVYARFGLAYYHAEVLHRGLSNLYGYSQARLGAPTTWPRIEEHISKAHHCTFGEIVRLTSPFVPPTLLPQFTEAVRQRNFLAHHFWYDRISLLTTSAGCHDAITELSGYSETFLAMNEQIDAQVAALLAAAGATPAQFAAVLEEVAQGRDAPHLSLRQPLKEEVVVAVYEINATPEGLSTLVFQTHDSALWQLCDVGFGWSAFDSVGRDWLASSMFSDVLPAHVNPRPRCEKPWHYEIFFRKGATLVVRPGETSWAPFRWTLRRKGV